MSCENVDSGVIPLLFDKTGVLALGFNCVLYTLAH